MSSRQIITNDMNQDNLISSTKEQKYRNSLIKNFAISIFITKEDLLCHNTNIGGGTSFGLFITRYARKKCLTR